MSESLVIHRPDAGEAGVCRGCVSDLEKRLAQLLANKGLDEVDLLSSQIPLIDWVVRDRVPGTISLTLLCYECPSSGINNFFYELVSYHLHPGHRATILSSRCLTFSFKEQPGIVFYYGEMLVGVSRESERKEMVLQVPHITRDLKRGIAHPEQSERILEERGLTPDQKIAYSRQRVLRFFEKHRIPYLEEAIVTQSLWQMAASTGSLKGRSLSHLSLLFASLTLLQQHVRKETYFFPGQRGVRISLLPTKLRYPFGTKEVCAIAVAIKMRDRLERLEETHLLSAVCAVIPGLKAVKGSFCFYEAPGDSVRMLYFEVEGVNSKRLSTKQIACLKRELGGEIKERVQKLTPSLSTQRNEEEVLHSLLNLAKELRYVNDPPQVVISYQEMTRDTLVFSVIWVHLIKSDTLPFVERFKKCPNEWQCRIDHERIVGTLRKKYPKKAIVFTTTFSKFSFLRKDYSVDLHRARSHIVEGLSKACGLFRDYNGGLMVKQSEVLSNTKHLLGDAAKEGLDLLEQLFYALSPAIMQSYLSPDFLSALFYLTHEVLSAPADSSGYLTRVRLVPGGSLLVIRGPRPGFKEEVLNEIEQFCPDPLSWASSFIEVGSACSLALLFLGGEEVATEMEERAKQAMQRYLWCYRNQQVARFHIDRATGSLDPRVGVDRRSGVLIKMLYEGLMRLGEEGRPLPAIARQIDISYDQRVFTFWLRDSYWSDGSLLTAHDFEYAWKKAVDPAFSSRHAYLFFPIKNARAIKEGKCSLEALGVRAEKADKLVVELEGPVPYFLDYVSHWSYSPVPRNIDERTPGWAHERGSSYISNGPFKLEKGRANEELFLVKNPHYWDARSVLLSEIHLIQIEDAETALALFDQGKIDWVGEPLCDLPKGARLRSSIKTVPIAGVCSLDINVHIPPFTSKKVRQALAYAISRKELVDQVLQGNGDPAFSLVAKGMEPGKISTFPDGDRIYAKKLFTKGLEELGVKIEEISPLVLSYPLLGDQVDVVKYIAQCWEETFGFQIILDGWPWESYLSYCYDRVFHIAAKIWHTWIEDPIYSLQPYEYAQNSFNGSNWENEAFTRLIQESESDPHPAHRLATLSRAEHLIIEEMPTIPLYHVRHDYLVSSKMKRVYLANIGQIDFKRSYISDEVPKSEGKADGRVLRLSMSSKLISLDPHIGGDSVSSSVVRMLFEGLMRIGPDGKLTCAVAQKVEIGSDRTLYTFTLRPTFWSDGTPLTAYDFEYAWKRGVGVTFQTRYNSLFSCLYKGKEARGGLVTLDEVGVRALGPDKLCVRLAHPVPYFLELISYPVFAPLPRHLMKSCSDWSNLAETLVGNGPFQLTDLKEGREISMVKNPYYWEHESVSITAVSFILGRSTRENFYDFEKGLLDWIGQPLSELPSEQMRFLGKSNNFHCTPVASVFRLDFITTRAPFSCRKMRLAFSYAIDRKALQREVLWGEEKLVYSLLPRHLACGGAKKQHGDKKKATTLFNESLLEQGIKKEDLSPIVISYPNAEKCRLVVDFVQQQWRETFEIPVVIEGSDWNDHLRKRELGRFQVEAVTWYSYVNDPLYNLSACTSSDIFYNRCGWSHPEYSLLLKKALEVSSQKEKKGYLKQAEHLLQEELPSVPLFAGDCKWLISDNLKNVYISPLGGVDFRWAKFLDSTK